MVRDKAANSGSNKIIKDQVTIKKVCLSSREQWEPLKSSKQGITDQIYKTGGRETNEDVRGGIPLTGVGLKMEKVAVL